MGYNLYITRKESWCDEGSDISANEWLDFVKNNSDLILYEENGPFFALWKTPNSNTEFWLDWQAGNIYSKNPEEILVRKMVEVAKALKAVVQGEEGEIYDENYRAINTLNTEKKKPKLKVPKGFAYIKYILLTDVILSIISIILKFTFFRDEIFVPPNIMIDGLKPDANIELLKIYCIQALILFFANSLKLLTLSIVVVYIWDKFRRLNRNLRSKKE